MNKTEFYKTSLNITNTDVHGYTKYLHELRHEEIKLDGEVHIQTFYIVVK